MIDLGRSFFLSSRDYDQEDFRRAATDIEKTAIKMVAAKLKEQAAAYGSSPWFETEQQRQAKREAIQQWETEATREAEASRNWSYSEGSSVRFRAGPAYFQLKGLANGTLRW